jgi:hypothetical protein
VLGEDEVQNKLLNFKVRHKASISTEKGTLQQVPELTEFRSYLWN